MPPDLFGRFPQADAPPLSDAERKRMRRRLSERPRGHIRPPGTGPDGETCGSCRHLHRTTGHAKTYRKCALNEAGWTGGAKSDIRARDAACEKWKPPDA